MQNKFSFELKFVVIAAFLLLCLVTAVVAVQLVTGQHDTLTFVYNSTLNS